MDRQTRDKFAAATPQGDALRYSPQACLETPPDLFAALNDELGPSRGFEIDLFANEENHLLPKWFGPGSPLGEDALSADWTLGGTIRRGFGNPPYGDFIGAALEKAIEEAEKGFISTFLLPLRINDWFKEIIIPRSVWRVVDERIVFWYKKQPKPTARVKVTRKHREDPAFGVSLMSDGEGYLCTRDEETGAPVDPILKPAGAMFDSIIATISPELGIGWRPMAPTVWNWKAKGK